MVLAYDSPSEMKRGTVLVRKSGPADDVLVLGNEEEAKPGFINVGLPSGKWKLLPRELIDHHYRPATDSECRGSRLRFPQLASWPG